MNIRKPPFILYKRGCRVAVVDDLKLLFKNKHIRKNDLKNIGKFDYNEIVVRYDENWKVVDKYIQHNIYLYTITDRDGNVIPRDFIISAFDEFERIDAKVVYSINIQRGQAIKGTGRIRRVRKRKSRFKYISALNEIRQTCQRYRDEFEPDVKAKRRHHSVLLIEDAYDDRFSYKKESNWKRYRKKQYK